MQGEARGGGSDIASAGTVDAKGLESGTTVRIRSPGLELCFFGGCWWQGLVAGHDVRLLASGF